MLFTPAATHQPRSPRLVTLALVLVAFVAGMLVGGKRPEVLPGYGQVTGLGNAPPVHLAQDIDFALFWRVWQYLHDNAYERPLKDTQLFYGALAGLVAGLGDPYSLFMDPETAQTFADELEGTFDGIGAEIGLRQDRLVIIAPLPNTPAENAGLKPGDAILAIDGRDTLGMSVDQAVALIRGQQGTQVALMVLANGDREPKQVKLTRAKIIIQVVQASLLELPGGGQVAYLKLVHFSQDVDQKLRQAWAGVAVKGPRGVIVDLRNNPGGFLDQAIAVAGHWVASGQVVVREQFAAPQPPRDYSSSGGLGLSKYPTVILVNQGSASASEIVTGALQDYGLATVVGEQTFGKGSVQDLQDFADGSAVKLTIAKWFTPKGRSIDGDGLKPDIVVERTREDVESDRDPQLTKALQLLGR